MHSSRSRRIVTCIMSFPQPMARSAQAVVSLQSVRTFLSFRCRGLFGAAIMLPAGALALFSEPQLHEAGPVAMALNAAGWMFFLLYVAWRLWATLFIGGRKDRELQTEGPYSVCRNPLYCGSLCYALSTASFLKSFTFAAAVVLVLVVYAVFVIRAEEHSLELRFGEAFRSYSRRTPRLWPRWSAFHTPPLVNVDLKRLKAEGVRLSRAALLPVLLEAVMRLRGGPWWPHWFFLP